MALRNLCFPCPSNHPAIYTEDQLNTIIILSSTNEGEWLKAKAKGIKQLKGTREGPIWVQKEKEKIKQPTIAYKC